MLCETFIAIFLKLYLGLCHTFVWSAFAKLLTDKSSIADVWQDPKYSSDVFEDHLWTATRGVFWTDSNIYDGAF